MVNANYFLGLDIGTNSVGWAVTNSEYKLLKYKNNLMWGVHLFDEATPAADRRSHRTARRRLNRRKQRVALLNEFFAKEILEIDPNFFMRLKESALLPEDYEHRKHNIFFEDNGYTDRKYFKEYPTIHHLICELIENKNPHDVRLVYYAVAYILKHRGHFLFSVDKDDISSLSEFEPIYDKFYNALSDICGDENVKFDRNSEIIKGVLTLKCGTKEKSKQLKEKLFGNEKSKNPESEILNYNKLVSFVCGETVNLSELFTITEYSDLENNKCCVKSADFSDKLEALEGQIDELHFELVAQIKAMYDWSLLVDILSGDEDKADNVLISKSKVEIYETHKDDLKKLKKIIIKYLGETSYKEVFKEISDKPNYASYVYNAPSDNSRTKYKKCSQEDFCKFVEKYLGKIDKVDDEDVEIFAELKEKCADRKLCPKQVTTDNRVIPYQLYYHELKLILENASEYLDFLNVKDEYGSVKDKILSIMEFRIPYYVGPLVGADKSKNAWLVKNVGKENEKIYPWNFDEIVNKDESERQFINRMTCKCTYLSGEDVLPKYSLLYSKFMVLNEINNIKIKGEPISVEEKQALYEDKFVNSKARVTKNRIAEYFNSKGFYANVAKDDISGIDDNVKSSLKSYHDFKNLLNDEILTESEVEKIIERITVTEDKGRLRNWLKKEFPQLSSDNVKYVSNLKYKDYGRLSEKFLEGLCEEVEVDYSTGEVLSDKGKNIITMLWETNNNLMELLSSNFNYSTSIASFNNSWSADPENKQSIDEKLKDMYVPVLVRRSIMRTLDVVKDIKRVQKSDPEKIFIEMARGEGETPKGKRTTSRREELEKILKGNEELLGELDKCDDGQLRSEKYYLYFKQLGQCMYTGKRIDFDDLKDDYKWNIDHIWPQAYIKDDSLDNKVLVDSNVNGEKEDIYPINKNIRDKMKSTWDSLRIKEQISEKKYQRLIRTTPFTDEELAGFINRQLVETRQSTKAVATILKEMFPNTEIVYVKAGLVSEFRHEMDMLKCRDINDVHHAKDAYLNIVLGNVYNTKFTHDPLNFIKKGEKYSLKMFKKGNGDKSDTGLMTRVVERNGVVAWNPSTSFDIVKKMMSKNNIRYVRYCYKRKGELFRQMPERKKEELVPRKNGLSTEKYGGFNNTTVSSFAVVKCKKDVIIIPVELMSYNMFFSDNEFMKEYAYDKLKFILPEKKYKQITKDDIQFPTIKYANSSFDRNVELKINSKVEVNGYPLTLCSKDSKGKYIIVASPVSLIVEKSAEKYIKKILNYLEKYPNSKVESYHGITKEQNLDIYNIIAQKCNDAPFNNWGKFTDMANILQNKRNAFCELSVEDQIKALREIISILKSGRSVSCDLSYLKESKKSCISKIGAIITDNKKINSVVIVDQSPSGLSEMKSENLLEL